MNRSFMKSSAHNNDKGEQKIRTIKLCKKRGPAPASAEQIVRERRVPRSRCSGERNRTFYDGPLTKPAHYVGLKDRTLDV